MEHLLRLTDEEVADIREVLFITMDEEDLDDDTRARYKAIFDKLPEVE